jgi:hypothetical protein
MGMKICPGYVQHVVKRLVSIASATTWYVTSALKDTPKKKSRLCQKQPDSNGMIDNVD